MNYKYILLSLILLMTSACNLPVSVEKNESSAAKENTKMVKDLLEDNTITFINIYINGNRINSTRDYKIKGTYLIDRENSYDQDNYELNKYNLGLLISASVEDNTMELQF